MRMIGGKTSKGGHYSPAVISGGTLYISGQLPIDHESGKVIDRGIEAQTARALANLDAILKEAGCRREDVVMCRVYVSGIELWDGANKAYAEFFGDHKPARVIVPTRELHHGALVEIEATAELPGQR